MSLAAYNTPQHEIRRHVTGVLNFACVLLKEVYGIESCLKFIYDAAPYVYLSGYISQLRPVKYRWLCFTQYRLSRNFRANNLYYSVPGFYQTAEDRSTQHKSANKFNSKFFTYFRLLL